MKRFMLPHPPDSAGTVRLAGRDYHYLARVRRLKAGAEFEALLPDGTEALVKVRSVDRHTLVGAAFPRTDPCADLTDAAPRLTLFQALPKPPKMDLIVRQAAESGVAAVVPFVSAYGTPADAAGTDRVERWQRIVREARQQSGSEVRTMVRPPCSFADLFRYWETLKHAGAAGILLHQTFLAPGGFHDCLAPCPPQAALAVGPEGGFSQAETAAFLGAGWKPVMLGGAVLRVETAALYAVAAAQVILLERQSWMWKNS
ncbi:MAG: 16S rRNA (uracil(1498)-N(3))-methyltransferase [Spirochaetaceae bacterium]|jgi:16S rRNA (uracil1498-N3)-methyltransferase|nr:16S rRNA (uracil(1498)-N(3))-methyltransferase [Spirochaetaceae bacterium]